MEENDYKLVEPYNPTDPIVKFDPELEKSHIVVPYTNTETQDDSSNINQNTKQNQTRYDAIVVPLIQINQYKLGDDQIEDVEIKIEKFLPELHLKIYDYDQAISKMNSPGMTSTATVIMTAPIEGVNKKISLDFYITSSTPGPNGIIELNGEMNIPSMNQVKNEQIGTEKLNTFNFLKKIAQDNKLGFAATEKCEEIEDTKWRQIYSQTFKDYIVDQLSFGGKDKDSIFDAWIDQFGYLVMVNMAFVMDKELDPNQLTMKVVKGSLIGDKKDVIPDQQTEEVLRIISNARNIPGESNTRFEHWSNVLNNDLVKDEGTSNKYYYMTSIGDENLIQFEDMDIVEPSADGQKNKETYKFDKCEFIGFEMDEDNPILVQKKIVSRFKTLMNYKQIFIEMTKPNYYLQRGTLLNVDFEEYNGNIKKTLAMNNGNAVAGYDESIENAELIDKVLDDVPEGIETSEMKDTILNEQVSLTNYALSGVYYINDITYKYSKKIGEIIQCMHLIKRGTRTNIINDSTPLVPVK